jgi:mRNA-degrading endonuclease RelE of RelBE toxin-antitoxin system
LKKGLTRSGTQGEVACQHYFWLDWYTALPYNPVMFSFVETPLFTKLVDQYLGSEDYRRLQLALIAEPESGPVIKGSGGVRKLRWAAPGGGKRGGYRVIYYLKRPKGVIWMLTMYPKNVADSIPAHVLKQIRAEIEDD